MIERRPTIAIDFDGVLHSYASGWTGEWPEDPPNLGAAAFVESLIEEGYRVVVHTARANREEGIRMVAAWLREWRFPPLEVTAMKPRALAYVDDRAVRHQDDFAETRQRLEEVITRT